MPVNRFLATFLACALTASAQASLSDLATWDFYRDAASATPVQTAAMTSSAAPNLAQLNFIDDVDIPTAYDIGYSSIDTNTVSNATAGYAFSASQDFTIAMHFSLTLNNPGGFVGLGLGIGEDREGVNSAGIGFGAGTFTGITTTSFAGAATNNDSPVTKSLSSAVSPTVTGSTYAGSLTVAYDATTGDITVGAAPQSVNATPLPPTGTATFTGSTDLADWAGDDLIVSFFLRSDAPSIFTNWTGDSAEADFFDFTVVQGSPTLVPEPASLAMLGFGLVCLRSRRRR